MNGYTGVSPWVIARKNALEAWNLLEEKWESACQQWDSLDVTEMRMRLTGGMKTWITHSVGGVGVISWILAVAGLLVVFLFLFLRQQLRWQRQQKRLTSRERFLKRRLNVRLPSSRLRSNTESSHPSSTAVWKSRLPVRLNSFDPAAHGGDDFVPSWSEREDLWEDAEDEMEAMLALDSYPYYGPLVDAISYECSTPPPTWEEASKRLLSSIKPLRRTLKLGLDSLTLSSVIKGRKGVDSTKEQLWSYPVINCGVSVLRARGGVLQIQGSVDKDEPSTEWLEHTFESSKAAAQFQIDVLATQWLGEPIENLYNAFACLHQGSAAHNGPEYVIHDDTDSPNNIRCRGVAWDDVMRCLGTAFPAIGMKLESLWWSDTSGRRVARGSALSPKNAVSVEEAQTSGDGAEPSMIEDYSAKRLLIGRVDFFRLFVPTLPENAAPHAKSSKQRMEQLLRWRKRVAKASVLVETFVRAVSLTHKGWSLGRPLPRVHMSQRLAYDDPGQNTIRDRSDSNVYYEGSVSRDIPCQVRGPDSLRSRSWIHGCRDSSESSYQGYSLVGMHIFQVPHSSWHQMDPVMSIPSLRELVEKYPDLDFFVCSWIPSSQQVVRIHVWVRSLPRGLDPAFDNVVEKFTNSGRNGRDKVLEVIFQIVLDTTQTQTSIFLYLLLGLVAILVRFSFGGLGRVRQTGSSLERAVLPTINASKLGKVYHFGGSLQENNTAPTNYVAATLYMDSRNRGSSFLSRLLICCLESEYISQHVLDSVIVLAGEQDDELPERALGTLRIVRSKYSDVALPASFLMNGEMGKKKDDDSFASIPPEEHLSSASRFFKILITDPVLAVARPVGRALVGIPEVLSPTSHASAKQNGQHCRSTFGEEARIVASAETFDKIVNEIIELLQDTTVPVSHHQLGFMGIDPSWVDASEPSETQYIEGHYDEDATELLHIPILRTVNRADILRYFFGSDCSVHDAAVRLVESTSWRVRTFPINPRTCQLELQNGQFFGQGHDLDGNPVFYFRNTLLGPWRGDEDAVLHAVLHRLESSLNLLAQENPEVKCTLIVSLGRPSKVMSLLGDDMSSNAAESTISSRAENLDTDDLDDKTINSYVGVNGGFDASVNNPRINADEHWYQHTNRKVVKRLVRIMIDHYPERLSRALVVIGHGNKSYTRTVLGGNLRLSGLIGATRTRAKIRFLKRYADLRRYVDLDELTTLCGGNAKVLPSAFNSF